MPTELLTVEAAAERLGLNPKTVWRKINAYRDRGPGHQGWPPGTWLNINPGGEKATIRINWAELVDFLANATKAEVSNLQQSPNS